MALLYSYSPEMDAIGYKEYVYIPDMIGQVCSGMPLIAVDGQFGQTM